MDLSHNIRYKNRDILKLFLRAYNLSKVFFIVVVVVVVVVNAILLRSFRGDHTEHRYPSSPEEKAKGPRLPPSLYSKATHCR